jgi:polysaccharide biosynthesis/export protein
VEIVVQTTANILIFLISLVLAAPAHGLQNNTTPAGRATGEGVTPAAVSPSLKAYTINPGDEIEIYVWREEQLQRAVKILPDGTFSFPLLGTVNAAGKTAEEIRQYITAGLENQYVDGKVPNVTVGVKNASGLQFSVIGKVKAAGTFTPGRYVTLLEALSLAGGADEFANLDNVIIIRKTNTGLVTVRARLADILRNRGSVGDAVKNIPMIESGDTVIVP